MSAFWIIVLIVAFAALVGFIVLQRRKPEQADAIASWLDSSAKRAEREAQQAAQGIKDKLKK